MSRTGIDDVGRPNANVEDECSVRTVNVEDGSEHEEMSTVTPRQTWSDSQREGPVAKYSTYTIPPVSNTHTRHNKGVPRPYHKGVGAKEICRETRRHVRQAHKKCAGKSHTNPRPKER